MKKKELGLEFVWNIRCKLWAEGNKLRAEGSKLRAEGSKRFKRILCGVWCMSYFYEFIWNSFNHNFKAL